MLTPRLPPLWREPRLVLEAAALVRDPIWSGHGAPPGDGSPVLLVPGFLTGSSWLAPIAHWLRRLGYAPHRAPLRANVDCSGSACAQLERQLELLAERSGTPLALIGHSRGGMLARVLASRRPELISGVVTLGSPTRCQLRVHPLVFAPIALVAALGSAGLPGLFSLDCAQGACCEPFRAGIVDPLAPRIGYVALYTRTDGIVDWRACLDPWADERIEVTGSHCGMPLSPDVYRVLASTLARFAARGD